MVTEVTIVRPKRPKVEVAGSIVGRIAGLFLMAYVVMLLLGAGVFGAAFTPGYWQTLGAVYVVRLVLARPIDWDMLTKRAPR